MRKSYKCSFNFIVFGFGMCSLAVCNSFRTGILCKSCAEQFGTNIPTSDTRRTLQQGISHFHPEFSENRHTAYPPSSDSDMGLRYADRARRILLFHQVLTYIDYLVDSFELKCRGQSGNITVAPCFRCALVAGARKASSVASV